MTETDKEVRLIVFPIYIDTGSYESEDMMIEITNPLTWLAGAILVIVAIVVTIYIWKLAKTLAGAGWDALTWIIVFVIIILVAGVVLWPLLDFSYSQNKVGAADSEIVHDIAALIPGVGNSANAYPGPNVNPESQHQPTTPVQPQGLPPSSQPNFQTFEHQIDAPPDFMFGRALTLKGTGDVIGWRATKQGRDWVFTHLILDNGQVVLNPGGLPAKIPPPPPPVTAVEVEIVIPTPIPTSVPPTPVPTPTPLPPDVVKARMKDCWLKAVGDGLFSGPIPEDPRFSLPRGSVWSLTGPGRGAAFQFKANERWLLSSPDLGIENIPIDGNWGRKFPSLVDNQSTFEGLGDICLQP